MPVRLDHPKAAAVRHLQPGSLAREVLLAQPDEVPEAEFDALLPALLRLLGWRE
jgi:hypothetical protein